jgi:hypothetical protein
MSREQGFHKCQFERILLSPIALHTSGDELVEFVSARAGIGSACRLPTSATLKSFIKSHGR